MANLKPPIISHYSVTHLVIVTIREEAFIFFLGMHFLKHKQVLHKIQFTLHVPFLKAQQISACVFQAS